MEEENPSGKISQKGLQQRRRQRSDFYRAGNSEISFSGQSRDAPEEKELQGRKGRLRQVRRVHNEELDDAVISVREMKSDTADTESFRQRRKKTMLKQHFSAWADSKDYEQMQTRSTMPAGRMNSRRIQGDRKKNFLNTEKRDFKPDYRKSRNRMERHTSGSGSQRLRIRRQRSLEFREKKAIQIHDRRENVYNASPVSIEKRDSKGSVPVSKRNVPEEKIKSFDRTGRKKRVFIENRGDSRKEETGGSVKPQNKKRLRFSYEETGAAEYEKKKETAKERPRNSREQTERYQNTDYFNLRENKEREKEKRQTYQTEKKKDSREIKSHSRKKQIYQNEQTGKKKSRLRHGEPESGKNRIPSALTGAVSKEIKGNLKGNEDDNSSVDGAFAVEEAVERSVGFAERRLRNRRQRTSGRSRRFTQRRIRLERQSAYYSSVQKNEEQKSRAQVRKQIQKARIKREYAKAKHTEIVMQGAPVGTIDYIKKIGGKVTDFFKENRKVYVSLGVLLALMMLIMGSFTSCSMMFFNNVVDYSGFSYMSTDEAIRDADLYYTQLEANLQERINNMETENGGYDRYQYDIGIIGHDPFVLISYLSSKYEYFTFDDTIKAELDHLFALQYQLTTSSGHETITETKTVKVGESLGAVVTSGYCNCSICCGQWAGGPTASGAYPAANHTIAVDAYTPVVPLGTKVVMNGREYVVEDTGNFSQYGVAFDVYYDDHATASNHGHQTWEAYLADANGSQEIEITTTSTQSVFSVTVTNGSLSVICQGLLDEEQKELFNGYNHAKGNLQMFESPVEFNWYYMISSYYGYRIHPISGNNQMHNGLDIAAPEGSSVNAGLTGRVTSATYNDSYGNYVIIEDSDGYELRYAHLQSISVTAGQSIEKGDQIGKVGNTGNSTGPHLHLELLHHGERLNPLFYFETGEGTIFGDVEYSSEAAQKLCEYSVQFLGTPYVWGGYAPGGFDCSGFVSYCLTNSGVKNTGHMDTWGLISSMTIIPESEMQPGDIIFFQGTYNVPPPSHVGIYLGNGQMVHSGHPNQIVSIYEPYYQSHWYAVGRW